MGDGIGRESVRLLRGRWPSLLVVSAVALGPAVAATSLIEVLGGRADAIVNGSVAGARTWTEVVLTGAGGGTQVRLTVPVLLALAWFVGLSVGLRVLAGAPPRARWRTQLGPWFALGGILALLGGLSLVASVVVSGLVEDSNGLLGVVTALLCAYGLARLSLALPAMLVDGLDLRGSLRRAVAVTRGRTLPAGTALILVGLGLPALVLRLVDPAILPPGGSWVEDVVRVGVGSMLEHLALVGLLPLQVAVLLGAYRVAAEPAEPPAMPAEPPAMPAEPQPMPAEPPAISAADPVAEVPAAEPVAAAGDELGLTVTVDGVGPPQRRRELPTAGPVAARGPGWLRVAGAALLVVVPPAVGPAAVLANPLGRPVLTIAHPGAGLSPRPLAMTVLDDGTVAVVDSMQAALCRDAHCTDLDLVTMPCYGGGVPEPVSGPVRGCVSEGPLVGADITPDGTLLGLTLGRDQDVRLFWCRLEATPDAQCRWGGVTVLARQPDLWQYWSKDVAALPGGGFAAIMIAPGPDEESLALRLALCDRLDCTEPTVHNVLTARTSVAGLVAVAADPATGSLALGYFDRVRASVSLGGCPAGCPDGPGLNDVYSAGEFAVNPPPRLQVAATPTGPTAVLNLHRMGPGPTGAVIGCRDVACTLQQHIYTDESTTNAVIAVNRSGEAYVVGSRGSSPLFGAAGGDVSGTLAGTGQVVAAACGPDGRLVLVLDDEEPDLALVTYAGPYCSGRP